jgi:starch synthase
MSLPEPTQTVNILMLSAENGALPGGKVGGMGDVIRDVPRALAALGHTLTIVTPAYGSFQHLPGAQHSGSIKALFRGGIEDVAIHTLPVAAGQEGVRQLVLEHPLFSSCGVGSIYCDDPPNAPYASDGSKFALFSAAVAQGLLDTEFGQQDAVHLHDWHTAFVALLLRCHPAFEALAELRLVFTIHNLAMQGIRPFSGHSSSLFNWFPVLSADPEFACLSDMADPRYPDCFNPMRAAIRLCDRVHTVSPTYVQEICEPGGEFGEGLQPDLSAALKQGRLLGILNGCEYPATLPEPLAYPAFLRLARREVLRWIGDEAHLRSAHMLAIEHIDAQLGLDDAAPALLLTAVGRLTDQKLGLLASWMDDGRTALEHVLDRLQADERLLILGSGQPDMEALCTRLLASDPRLLFLRGYSEALSAQLYATGDLFLMPSRFEPCGIAQMLAMRAGQPCLVNRTGGLADTVVNDVDGFVFEGEEDAGRARAMLARLDQALTQLRSHPRKAAKMRKAAGARRFPWADTAKAYLELLYTGANEPG